MAYRRTSRPEGSGYGGGGAKPWEEKRICRLCKDKKKDIDYKETGLLRRFITDRGKILPRRITKCCAKHQRILTRAIKRARNIALMPFIVR
ncbi:30S ribosomal protein S18 [bacterium]|nr:30S ribosomal protein S18 [bacterium]